MNQAQKMKIFYLLAAVALFGAVGATGYYLGQGQSQKPAEGHDHPELWYCPMHPNITSDKPGKCPICNMDLVKGTAANAPSSGSEASAQMPKDHMVVNLDEYRRQMIGVTFATAEVKPLFRKIAAAGRVAFDPDLYTAQSEYLEALQQKQRLSESPIDEAKSSADRMLEAARLRLKVLGFSDSQIDQISSKSQDSSNLIVARAGKKIWVYAEVFEMDLPQRSHL